MATATDPPTTPATPAAASPPPARRWLSGFVREVLLPTVVLVGLFAIAVALIEGPPLQQFLYAVF
jgi:hypothetical protein